MPTCTCGKTVDDWRGARGHVQFTAGGPHGEKGEVPDDWKQLFDEADDEADDEQPDEDGQQAAADAGGDESDQSPSEQPERDSGQSEPSESKGRIRRFLTTPLDELLGHGE